MGGYTNLEAICARCGAGIAECVPEPKRGQTLVRNAMGVLREDGVYAFYLYLLYRADEGGDRIWAAVRDLWRDPAAGSLLVQGDDEGERVIALTEDLHRLLLARQLAERALVYALYGLRAGRQG